MCLLANGLVPAAVPPDSYLIPAAAPPDSYLITAAVPPDSYLIPAAAPPDSYLMPLKSNRPIRPKGSEDLRTTNTVDRSARKNTRCYAVETTTTVIFSNSETAFSKGQF